MTEQRETLETLSTPALVCDRAALGRNVARMDAALARHGVPLRQHVKTHKSVDVARIVGRSHGAAITVSTLREAEHFAAAGFTDQIYAVGVAPSKVARIGALAQRGARVRVITDDLDAVSALDEAARDAETALEVLVEIDVGQHRGGLAPDAEALLDLAAAIARAPALSLAGVLAHGGHSYECTDPGDLARVAEEERAGAVHAAERLRGAGHAAPIVSVGSTPTALFARSLSGVTEVRAGVFVFMDLCQSALGCAPAEDVALSVLASVIGVRRVDDTVLIDAGALALSKDRSMDARGGSGFGEVRSLGGTALEGRPRVEAVNQEHGFVRSHALAQAARIGDRVRVLPNHACMTAAMYDEYAVVDGGGLDVMARWPRVNGF